MPSPSDTYNYRAMIQERADLIAEAGRTIEEAMAREDHALTDEEKERDDAIKAKLGELNESIDLVEQQRERERDLAKVRQAEPDPETGPADKRNPIHTRPNTPSGGPGRGTGLTNHNT